jgi:hypothetical protein
VFWKLFVENPEEVDDQGIYIQAWGTNLPMGLDEFDGINDPVETGIVIRDLASAQRWAREIYGLRGDVKEIEII